MPAATAPLGKPSAASKPTGFTKPAGLSRQTGSAEKSDGEEEEGEKQLQPVHIGISAVALLLALLFMWTVYKGDQVPNRVSDYLFGQPTQADASAPSDYASDDNEASNNDAADDDENDGDEEEEDEED